MSKKTLKNLAIAALSAAAAGAAMTFLVRDQLSRHRRDLFSPYALRRLAALGGMARQGATVDNINLLKDYIAWEPRGLLRDRARAVLDRMEEEARARPARTG